MINDAEPPDHVNKGFTALAARDSGRLELKAVTEALPQFEPMVWIANDVIHLNLLQGS
ncbi:MAG: hypothetical protein ACJ76N_18750 [Thermoanaerobaculia bacterium]